MSYSRFIPLAGAANPHIQTLLPRLIRHKPDFDFFWQRLELPDGDFVDLAWTEDPQQAKGKPRLVIFHGLEGSAYSPYAHGLLSVCRRQNWLGVVMHFRSCSGEPNRNQRIYHSGETEDARYFLNWLPAHLGHHVPTIAVGYSLGGNMLGYYLGQEEHHAPLDGAVIVSAPLMLEPSSHRLEHGFSRFYQAYLLAELKKTALRKLEKYPGSLPVSADEIRSLKKISEFDEVITAPIHHFQDASDYYQRCSAKPLIHKIRKPLLIIHALDDPFMAPEVLLDPHALPQNIEYQLTEHGGHVGFVSGTWREPVMWLEERIAQWAAPLLSQQQ